MSDRWAPHINAPVRAYAIIAATAAEIRFNVQRDPALDALRLLRSGNRQGTEVGYFDLRVPAVPSGPTEVVAAGTNHHRSGRDRGDQRWHQACRRPRSQRQA